MRSLVICTPTKYCVGGKIGKNEMGRACGAYGGRGEVCTGFWWGNLRERDHWGDPDIYGRIILRWIFRKWEGGCGDWMESAQDMDIWLALENTVMNIRIPKMRGIS
jgi:hypothetical protein